ncbi:MAG: hypothetical protein KF814_02815 [Nitrospiraceae bacterium]|nr:hypothetical protein [Nitrospiraceae bacterium]
MRHLPLFIALIAIYFGAGLATPPAANAVEKSFYSPVIHVDKENSRILISTSGSVFWIEVPEAARPHMDKLPISGLADFVVEVTEGQPPVLKSWKVKSGESTCLHFDGKVCK